MPEELLQDKPLAIVGAEDVVMGFYALGFKTYPVKDVREFKVALDEMLKNKIGVCLVEDEIYQANKDLISNYKNIALPIFMPFSKTAPCDLLDNLLKEIRLRATGAF